MRLFAAFSLTTGRLWSRVVALLGGVLALGGCIQPLSPIVPSTALPTNAIQTGPLSTFPWTDENVVMSGVCFESALDAAGEGFVVRNPLAHIQFYDLADNSNLCRRPVRRYPFDFSGGRILAGLWSYGKGCTARHDVLSVQRDDAARTLVIRLRFVTEGTCPYELLRPFWIGLSGVSDYQIDIQVADR